MNALAELHGQALSVATAVIAALEEHQWEQPSACAGWTVRDLVRHMVGQNFGFAAAVGEGDAPSEAYEPREVDEWTASVDLLARAVEAPSPAIRLVEVRRSQTFALEAVLGMHLLDTVVHTWDICGPPWRPAPDVVDQILGQARRIPDAARGGKGPFGPVASGRHEDPWHEALRLLGRDAGRSHQPRSGTTTDDFSEHHFRTALVLAGAGAAGNAWELGLIAGLADAGLDVTGADLTIGTSAGSTVAAQVTSGTPPTELYAAILAEVPRRQGAELASHRRAGADLSGPSYVEWSNTIIGSAADAADMRRRMGAAALGMGARDGSGGTRWRDVVSARLPSHDWPRQRVQIAAVDADTGEPVVFDCHSGVELVDAVAASTSSGFAGPYTIGENRYINGGYRRSENADLAAGYGRVLVLSPFSGRSRMPPEWGMDLATQVSELRAGGSTVETVFPDGGAGDVFDANALDPSTRPQAARGGYDQGMTLAEQLSVFWR